MWTNSSDCSSQIASSAQVGVNHKAAHSGHTKMADTAESQVETKKEKSQPPSEESTTADDKKKSKKV